MLRSRIALGVGSALFWTDADCSRRVRFTVDYPLTVSVCERLWFVSDDH